jgi:hypothetical protein
MLLFLSESSGDAIQIQIEHEFTERGA